MAQGDTASEGLIEVAAGTHRDWKPVQLIRSGITPSLTCQLYVGFRTNASLTFDFMPGPRTAMVREFGYRLVEGLERVSRRLPDWMAPPQRACLALQRAFAERFVLPRYRLSASASARSVDQGESIGKLGFEATRRVFKFEAVGAAENLLICHVLAQRQYRSAEHLLVEFVKAVGRGDEPESVRCDPESGLCLWSGPGGHLAGRSYREILIGSPDVLPSSPPEAVLNVSSVSADRSPDTGHQVLDRPKLDDTMSINGAQGAETAGDNVYDAFDAAFYARSEADWELVAGQIEQAHRAGRDLDEAFIESVARQRLELARTYDYSDRPDAGPTLESSLGIVRSILNLHLTALDQYEAEERD